MVRFARGFFVLGLLLSLFATGCSHAPEEPAPPPRINAAPPPPPGVQQAKAQAVQGLRNAARARGQKMQQRMGQTP